VIASPLRPPAPTGTGHRCHEPARPPRAPSRRFTLVRHHRASTASSRPALTEAHRRQPTAPADRPVNSGPRPCLIDVGFPLSGPQDRISTSDLNVMPGTPVHSASPTARLRGPPPKTFRTTTSSTWMTPLHISRPPREPDRPPLTSLTRYEALDITHECGSSPGLRRLGGTSRSGHRPHGAVARRERATAGTLWEAGLPPVRGQGGRRRVPAGPF
jgi:hypothetical protein